MADVHAVLDGLAHLFRGRRHLVFLLETEHLDMRRAQARRRARGIDGDVAAAHHHGAPIELLKLARGNLA